jgi:hypothetical protein
MLLFISGCMVLNIFVILKTQTQLSIHGDLHGNFFHICCDQILIKRSQNVPVCMICICCYCGADITYEGPLDKIMRNIVRNKNLKLAK